MSDSIVLPSTPMYAAIETVAIDAWVKGLPFSQAALAERIAGEIDSSPDRVAQSLAGFLSVLNDRGMYASQRARYGAKDSGPGQLTSPQWFNWSSVSVADATLRHGVEPYLKDRAVQKAQRHAVRSALRFVLELPTKCDDGRLLRACERVGGDEIYFLPNRAFEAAVARHRPLARQTAANHRSALRCLLRYSGAHRLLPLVFPKIWSDNPWERDKDRYFPLAREGPTSQRIVAWRSAWMRFATAIAEVKPDQSSNITAVSRPVAEEVISYMQLKLGQHAHGYNMRGALRYIAEQFGEGPFSDPSAADAFKVVTETGVRQAVYLRGTDGGAGAGDWENFFQILTQNRLPVELVEFFRWYRKYITASALDTITSDEEFPPRRERLRLDDNTLLERMTAIRAMLGVATYELHTDGHPAPFGLGLDPSTLVPDVVFGSRFQDIVKALIKWWRARADALPIGAPGKSLSGSLRQMIIALGMLALAHYERLRHRRSLSVATERTPGGDERIDWRAEESATKTPGETAAWDAYRYAGRMADALAGGGKGQANRMRSGRKNDFKDIRKIIENTPPAFWIALLQGLTERFRGLKRRGQDGTVEYHQTVANAFMLGMLISTGCRIEELCHIRLDIQAVDFRTTRIIHLRDVDRKNAKTQDVVVQAEFVPDDLRAEYLDTTRPYFLAGSPSGTKGTLGRTRPPRKRRPVDAHPWLMLSSTGRAWGCIGEGADGTLRDKRAFKSRCNQAGRRFTVQMANAAVSLNLPLSGRKYEFGPHAVRGACGYGVYLLRGEQKAAHYLGDTEATVRDDYAAINGLYVDSTCLLALDLSAERGEEVGKTGMSASLHQLVRELERKVIDSDRFLREAAAIIREAA